MSRHSRTSTASAVLKLCKDTNSPISSDSLDSIRLQLMDDPDIPEELKDRLIDQITIVVARREFLSNDIRKLEEILNSI